MYRSQSSPSILVQSNKAPSTAIRGSVAPHQCGATENGPTNHLPTQSKAASPQRTGAKIQRGRARPKAVVQPPKAKTLTLSNTPYLSGPENDFMGVAAHHMNFLAGPTFQCGALTAVTANAGVATVGLPLTVLQMGAFYPVFGVMATIASTAGIAAVEISAKEARQRYLVDIVLLKDQQRLQAEVQKRIDEGQARPEDASSLALADANIRMLQARATAYEAAVFRDPKSPHVQETRSALEQQALAIVELKVEYDQCTEEMVRLNAQLSRPHVPELLRASLASDIAGLERRRTQLSKRVALLRKPMKKRLLPDQVKKGTKETLAKAIVDLKKARKDAFERQWSHGPDQTVALEIQLRYAGSDEERQAIADQLAEAKAHQQEQQHDQATILALEQKIEALTKDLRQLSRRIDKVLMDPFGDRGPTELARLQETVLGGIKVALDMGGSVNTALNMWHLLQSLSSVTTFMPPLWLLTLVSAGTDIVGGHDLMDRTAAQKGPVLDRATLAAALLEVYGQDNSANAKICQYLLLGMEKAARTELWILHRTSQWGKTRKANGLKDIFMVIALVIAAGVTFGTGFPVLIPVAAVGAGTGTTYAAAATRYLNFDRTQKQKAKREKAIGKAFKTRFGEAGVAEFYNDMAAGHTHRWDKRLESLRQQLRAADGGRQIDAELLQPQVLMFNSEMRIHYLFRALKTRARDRTVDAFGLEAKLVSQLAAAQGKPDPGAWDLESFASPDLYAKKVRAALSDLFGSSADAGDGRLLDRPRKLAAVAGRVNDVIVGHISQRNELSDQETLWTWIGKVAAQPEKFGELLADLDDTARQRLKDQLVFLGKKLGEEGIGQEELFDIQLLSLQKPGKDRVHPLKAMPKLLEAPMPYLLELIADPSRLDEPLAAPAAALPAARTGTQAVSQVIGAIKTVGRELRDGPKPAPALPPAEGGAGKARGHEGFVSWVTRRPHAVRTHFQQQTPNPLGTPQKALKRLEKLEKRALETQDNSELLQFVEQVLVALAKQGGGLDMPSDPTFSMEQWDPGSASEIAMKREHLAQLLQSAEDASRAVEQWEKKKRDASDPGDAAVHGAYAANDASGRKHLHKRMAYTARFCAQLKQHLAPDAPSANDDRWNSMMKRIPVKPAAAAAA